MPNIWGTTGDEDDCETGFFDSSDYEPIKHNAEEAETYREMTTNRISQNNNAEYREYLRLKNKYE